MPREMLIGLKPAEDVEKKKIFELKRPKKKPNLGRFSNGPYRSAVLAD